LGLITPSKNRKGQTKPTEKRFNHSAGGGHTIGKASRNRKNGQWGAQFPEEGGRRKPKRSLANRNKKVSKKDDSGSGGGDTRIGSKRQKAAGKTINRGRGGEGLILGRQNGRGKTGALERGKTDGEPQSRHSKKNKPTKDKPANGGVGVNLVGGKNES